MIRMPPEPSEVPRARELDPDSVEWLASLRSQGRKQDRAHRRLHELCIRAARTEMNRRRGRIRIAGPELDDLAEQAAADAMVSVIAKLDSFRGESRFTTWVYKFVIFEVSAKVGRHFSRHETVAFEPEDWDRLAADPDDGPAASGERRELVRQLRRAIDEDLTEHQRRVFEAIALQGVPLDALVVELDTNRNAIYKTMFDARRKLRVALAANGYLDPVGRGERGAS
jgi:RNA polymerase sigma-70 factor (ECF subfamily)